MRYLILFLILFLRVGWADDKEISHLNSAIRSQNLVNKTILNRIEKYRGDIAEEKADLKKLEEIEAALEDAEKRIEELRNSFLELEDKLFDLERIEEAYRTHFVPKVSLKAGQQVGSFTDVKGVAFTDVTVAGVRDGKVNLKHSRGLSTIPLSDLPKELLEGSVLEPTDVSGPYKLTFQEVIHRRPREIVSRQIAKELESRRRDFQERLKLQKKREAEADWQVRSKEKQEATAALLAERKAEEKAEAEKSRKILGYRQEIESLMTQRRAIEQKKARMVQDFTKARVKPDRRAHEAAMQSFDASIRQYNAAIRAIDTKIKQLR